MRCRSYLIMIFLCLLFHPGCGSPSTVSVEGTVTYAGQPVFPGSIIFMGDDFSSFSGTLSSEGRYRIASIKPGDYQVCIQTIDLPQAARNGTPTSPAVTAGDTKNENLTGDDQPMIREETVPEKFKRIHVRIPAKYRDAKTSGLTAKLKTESQPNPLDFNLD